MKKLLSSFLAVSIFISMLTVMAFADDETRREIDLREYDDDALVELFEQVKTELETRHIDYAGTQTTTADAGIIKSQSYDYGDGDTLSMILTNEDEDKLVLSLIGDVDDTEKASIAFICLLSTAMDIEKAAKDGSVEGEWQTSVAVFSNEGSVFYVGGRIAGTNSDNTAAMDAVPDWVVADEENLTIESDLIDTYASNVFEFAADFLGDLPE